MSDIVRFGDFEADVKSGELRREGRPIVIQDLPFRLLVALLERPGEVVTRAELAARLWGADTFVDSGAGLNTAVAKLREAFADDAERPVWIETIPKRGYRFIGKIEQTNPPEGGSNVPTRTWNPVEAGFFGFIVTRRSLWLFAMAIVIAAAAYAVHIARAQTRVAVVLFDNETGQADFGRLAQGLTDAAVFELTRRPALAVIGNDARLRTTRPFRDIAEIRDALSADFIVIGQVQLVDGQILVRSHLIRAKDEAHVWVGVARLTSSEAALQSEVAERIAAAVAKHYIGLRAVTTTSGS